MKNKDSIIQLITEQGVLPLFFHQDPEVCKNVFRSLYAAGIRTIEFTNRGAAALENFKVLRELCNQELPGMILGVGTIKTRKDAENFIEAGTDYIVSPGLVEEVVQTANENQLLWLPGCMTPSEIIQAENWGAKTIKLFPGNMLGPSFLKAVKAVFPDLLFMPTGGVTAERENLENWFNAGVWAVGMGSQLIRKDLLEARDYEKIKENTLKTVALINQIKQR